VIRQDIEQTRESLAHKVEKLEEEVKDTIGSVRETVESTIDTVKEKVQDTVESVTAGVEQTVSTVKRTFDVPYQVQRHPWAMAGCSLLTGAALGYFLTGRRHGHGHGGGYYREPARPAPHPEPQRSYQPAASNFAPAQSGPAQPGMLSRLIAPFESEINKVKETAVGAMMGMLRDVLKRSLPPTLAANVDEIMDSATRKAGGEPVRGPVLPQDAGTGPSGGAAS